MSRSLNRHHTKRIKNKVKTYNNYFRDKNPRKIGILANTPCICSCSLCSCGHWLKAADKRKLNDPDYDVAWGFLRLVTRNVVGLRKFWWEGANENYL